MSVIISYELFIIAFKNIPIGLSFSVLGISICDLHFIVILKKIQLLQAV